MISQWKKIYVFCSKDKTLLTKWVGGIYPNVLYRVKQHLYYFLFKKNSMMKIQYLPNCFRLNTILWQFFFIPLIYLLWIVCCQPWLFVDDKDKMTIISITLLQFFPTRGTCSLKHSWINNLKQWYQMVQYGRRRKINHYKFTRSLKWVCIGLPD